MNLLSKVNPLQGTNSIREFSTGNTLPLAARPWGMHHWTFQTGGAPWTFHPSHRKLWGVRLTHQPSPWMRDYASLLVSAFHGDAQESVDHQSSAWRIEDAVIRPNYLKAELLRYRIEMEMAPTERGAVFVFTKHAAENLCVRFHFDGSHELDGAAGGRTLRAVSRDHHGGVPENFGLHLYGEFNVAPERFVRLRDGGYWVFPRNIDRVEFRLSGSFIGETFARRAFARELTGRTLNEIEAEGGRIWNALLGRIEIDATDERQERTFYSCLYRCLLFPRFMHEIDENGGEAHFSPFDGGIHAGPLCTDNGFWDTFRTLYPLLALVYPDKLRRMLEGWLNACREAGWSPKWASPGLRDCMIGTHFDAVVADAVAKGIVDWDVDAVFAYLWKNATEPSEDGRFGRRGLDDFVRLGYVSADRVPYAVSRTLDFSYNDFCVAQVAKYLGKEKEAAQLRPRTLSYRNVFDASVGFMRARMADGRWEEPFREFAWGGSYIEGSAWQHAFNVPHDPAGLAALFGGPQALCRKLDAMLATPPIFEAGSYGYEIHEMTEMALAGFGQYAHSNQPVHNYLFLYALAGEPAKTSYWVHRVARELYAPDFLPGDEDNGEMSAWYVFACLGIYPFCPGKAEYVRFIPLARSAQIRAPHLDGILCLEGSISPETTISHEALLRQASLTDMLH